MESKMGYWGYILLAIWLILSSLVSLFHINLQNIAIILPLLSLIAGILIFIGGLNNKFKNNLGGLFLSIWLIIEGLQSFVHIGNVNMVLAILAIVAGILMLIKK
jgi:hypothetical protein